DCSSNACCSRCWSAASGSSSIRMGVSGFSSFHNSATCWWTPPGCASAPPMAQTSSPPAVSPPPSSPAGVHAATIRADAPPTTSHLVLFLMLRPPPPSSRPILFPASGQADIVDNTILSDAGQSRQVSDRFGRSRPGGPGSVGVRRGCRCVVALLNHGQPARAARVRHRHPHRSGGGYLRRLRLHLAHG